MDPVRALAGGGFDRVPVRSGESGDRVHRRGDGLVYANTVTAFR